MRRRQAAVLSIVAAVAVVVVVAVAVVVVVVTRGPSVPRATTITTSSTTVTTSTTSPKLVSIRGPKGSREVFSASGGAVFQGTGQIPPGAVVTLYFACLGTAPMKISVGGSPLLTTPCIDEVGTAEVPSASSPRDVVITSPLTDRWRVTAYELPLS
jgi:hypothetical protein